MNKIYLCLFLISFLSSAFSSDEIPEPFIVKVQANNTLIFSHEGLPAIVKSNQTGIIGQALGNEKNACPADQVGRQSSTSGDAKATTLAQSRNGISLNLSANAIASGGYYRNCVACVFNGQCGGILPINTQASTLAQSSAKIILEANPEYPEREFDVIFNGSGNNANPIIKMSTQSDPIKIGDKYKVKTEKGKIYYIDIEIEAFAKDKGLCCHDNRSASFNFDIRWYPSAILASQDNFQPFVVGGLSTTDYRNVGLFIKPGSEPHCTGTVIGDKTVLTAAHCVYGEPKERLSFIIGSGVNQWDNGPFQVRDFEYPDENTNGFTYNPITYEDDIAVVHFDTNLGEDPVRLPQSSLDWKQFKERKTNFIFVGFGLDNIDKKLTGAGIKRYTPLYLNTFDNRTVIFKVPGKGTCKGDSGGPGFWVDETDPLNKKMYQVLVTSLGNWKANGKSIDPNSCTEGKNTRVDVFLPWLTSNRRIQ